MTPVEVTALGRAVGLAAHAQRRSRPNPAVGCVLLRGDEVVGDGATQQVGGAHAEVVALRAAGDRARGATAVVTLEPCDHTGRTGPCSTALLEAGVARVVHALTDASDVAAGGAARLRGAGIPVEQDDPGGWAAALTADFAEHLTTGLPRVDVKLAVTDAGAVVAPDGGWITGPAARRRVHRLRADADAVLVGVGTVLADDPSLDVRHVAPTAAGQPVPVVLDSDLRTPPGARVVARGALVVAATDADDGRAAALEREGARVLRVDRDGTGHLDASAALRAIAEHHDVRVVLAEPGPTLAAALVRDRLASNVLLHVGGGAGRSLPSARAAAPLPLDGWRRSGVVRLGQDVEVRLSPPGVPA